MKQKCSFKKSLFFVLSGILIFGCLLIRMPLTGADAKEQELSAIEIQEQHPEGGLDPYVVIEAEDNDELLAAIEKTQESIVLNLYADPDSVLVKGASHNGYDSLESDAERTYYNRLNQIGSTFLTYDKDIEGQDDGKGNILYLIGAPQFDDLGLTRAQALHVYWAYDFDHPNFYWTSNAVQITSTRIYMEIYEIYASAETRRRVDAIIEEGAKEYLELAGAVDDTLDKILLIHDLMVTEVDYAKDSAGNAVKEGWAHNLQGVFDPELKSVVCEGYADTFALLMNCLDIPNYFVSGTASSGGGHAWNLVSDDGGKTYFYMDLTWDDLGEDGGFTYMYFGMPKTEFEKKHTPFPSNPSQELGFWYYDINCNISNTFEGTYYYKGGIFYKGDGTVSKSELANYAMTKSFRLTNYVSYLAKDESTLGDISYYMGVNLTSYYTVFYEGASFCIAAFPVNNKFLNVNNAIISFPQREYLYLGEELTPDPIVTLNDVRLIKGWNYYLDYYDNGEGSDRGEVYAIGHGYFCGSRNAYFYISQPRVVSQPRDIDIKDTALETSTVNRFTVNFDPVRVELYRGGKLVQCAEKGIGSTFGFVVDADPKDANVVPPKYQYHIYYSKSGYVATREFTVTKELAFLSYPISYTVFDTSNASAVTISWSTNFIPNKIEIYSDNDCIITCTDDLSDSMSAAILADKKTDPKYKFIRAYYGNDGYYTDSSLFTVTKNYKFVAQPSDIEIGLESDDKAGEVSWTTNFVPVKFEVYSDGVLVDSFTPATGSTDIEFSREVAADPEEIAEDKFVRAYYSETGYLDSDIFQVKKVYGFLTQPQSVEVAADSSSLTATVSWSSNFVPVKVEVITKDGIFQDVDEDITLAKSMSLAVGVDPDNAIENKYIRLYYSPDIFFESERFVVFKHFHEFAEIQGKPATCVEEGQHAYYVCTLDNCGRKFWDKDGLDEITDDDDLIIPVDPDAHVWGEVHYIWADDLSACTATCTCQLNDEHVESEDVEVQSEVIEEPSCVWTGIKKYTATFTNPAFETQYKEVEIPVDSDAHLWGYEEYIWAEDYSTCTATRTCQLNDNHVESEVATAESTVEKEATCSETGIRKYTATFTNTAFETQYEEVEIPIDPDAHEWGEWVVTVPPTVTSEGERQRVCKHNPNHVETEKIDKLTNNPTFTITEQPQNATVYENELAYFEVKASTGNLSYSWEYKYAGTDAWVKWTSKKTAKISVAYSKERNGMSLRCTVTDAEGGFIISDEAVLEYTQRPAETIKITAQPQNSTVPENTLAYFGVSATGNGLKYLWQYKEKGKTEWTDWTTKTTATISVAYSKSRNGMALRCKITDKDGNTVTSDEAVLTYESGNSPAITITTQPQDTTVPENTLAYFSVNASGSGLKYLWQYKEKGKTEWTDWTTKTKADISVAYSKSRNGMSLRCKITDKDGNTATTNAAVLTYGNGNASAITITTQPQDTTVPENTLAYFSVNASGSGLKYLWQYKEKGKTEWTDWTTKTKADISVAYSKSRNGMSLRCKITDKDGNTATSNAAVLTYGNGSTSAITITTQPQNTTVPENTLAYFSVNATGNGLKYLWQYKEKGKTEWTDWTTKTTATISVAYSKSRNGMSLRCKITDKDGNTVTSGEAVLTYGNGSGSGVSITTQPVNAVVDKGELAYFEVKASGTGLKYQWQYKLAGEDTWITWTSKTTAKINVAYASYRDGMSLRCIVTDSSSNTAETDTVTLHYIKEM
ncbi:MAG: hypothetical protein K6E47_00760 [Lachnospiraceae bacterium]|nr:hypothetical protein [Lachnospiraceae bacterium]